MQISKIGNKDIPQISYTDGTEFIHCTTNSQRIIGGAFYPESVSEIKDLIAWARVNKHTLWPISTGKNWGYGSALPVTDNCFIVSLSKFTAIRDFNPETGVITIEPGVTQQALYEFLKDTHYINPVTGAGPETSVLGNALERGYGLAPIQDHFSAILSVNAILGSGEEYQSPLAGIAGAGIDTSFKWGIGPYLDGLFGQSNFGIVTRVTIQLAKKVEHQRLVKLSVSNKSLGRLVNELQQTLQDYEGIMSGVNLMNKHRVHAMGVENAPDWTGIFAVSSSNKTITNAAYKDIRKRLKKHSAILSISSQMLDLVSSLPLPKFIRENVDNANSIKAVLNGEPTRKALNLTYLHNSTRNRTYNPDQDNCGLIWYAPLVEMNDYAVDNYIKHVHSVCQKHDIEPLITLTSLNGRCFDSTVPILFNKHSVDHSRRADACFDELLDSGREKGYFPYRLPIDAMQKLSNYNPDFFNQVLSIKEALDPDKVIAPGRYCPVSRRDVTGNIVEGRFNKTQ